MNYVRRQNGVAFPTYREADWRIVAHRAFRENDFGRPVLDYDSAISVPIKAGRLVVPPETVWNLFRGLASSCPTLVIRGALSDILSVDTVVKMREQAPSMKYAEIVNVGHAPVLTEPQARKAILEFLGSVG
jgi:pimeloyl-ACP methyl ester carboxylesterase